VAHERRRTPRQERSRATHAAIVEAAARVFAEVGVGEATTARIAEVAGVSPGSMYHYFPDKESLVTALFERESQEQHAAFLRIAGELGTDDVPRLVRALVAWNVGAFEGKRDLFRVLLHQVPAVSGLAVTQAIDHTVAQSLRVLLELGKDRCKARDLDTAALLVVRAFRYCVIPLIEEPLEGARREAFIDELADMICAYLLLPRPWRSDDVSKPRASARGPMGEGGPP
jgi:AcrR family transcriptional regulator